MTAPAAAQQALAEAQEALRGARWDEAAAAVARLRRLIPRSPAPHQLAAALARAQGHWRDAVRHRQAAVKAGPGEAGLWAELAQALAEDGRAGEAERAYDRALALDPRMVDAAIDRAVLIAESRDAEAGRQALGALADAHPQHLRAWRNRAALARTAHDTRDALRAADHVVARAPADPAGLAAAALARADAGLDSADAFARALAAQPGNRPLATRAAGALAAEGRAAEAAALAERLVALDPFDPLAQRTLAEIRWSGLNQSAEDALRGYALACQRPAAPFALWHERVRLTLRLAGPAPAREVALAAEAALESAQERLAVRALAGCEQPDPKTDAALLPELSRARDPALRLLHLRWLCRLHAFDAAAPLGERLWREGLGRSAMPYVAMAWRGLGDPRWEDLERGGALAQTADVTGGVRDWAALAERLRAVHRQKRAPMEQSLRGGTQTDGFLFARLDPEIEELREACRAAVRDYAEALPRADRRHPLLSLPRTRPRFVGAWSVRLGGAGHHVAHIHPEGDISSACYIAVPDGTEGGTEEGWLMLGEPPPEFGLDWPPLRRIAPVPGRLALFPSWMWHGTRPFAAGERLTVAFDVRLD